MSKRPNILFLIMDDQRPAAQRLPYRENGHTMEWEEQGMRVRGHSTELFCDAAIEEISEAPKGVALVLLPRAALAANNDPLYG